MTLKILGYNPGKSPGSRTATLHGYCP